MVIDFMCRRSEVRVVVQVPVAHQILAVVDRNTAAGENCIDLKMTVAVITSLILIFQRIYSPLEVMCLHVRKWLSTCLEVLAWKSWKLCCLKYWRYVCVLLFYAKLINGGISRAVGKSLRPGCESSHKSQGLSLKSNHESQGLRLQPRFESGTLISSHPDFLSHVTTLESFERISKASLINNNDNHTAH